MAKHPEIYRTSEWQRVRQFVIIRANGLCEKHKDKGELRPGLIVHHKQWLTDKNKHDWNISYNPENLIYLCNECHEEEHNRTAGLSKFLIPPGLENK